ncbi:MAG: hypothetical protein D6713_08590, partial [Deltaproteobacteria bacterium]
RHDGGTRRGSGEVVIEEVLFQDSAGISRNNFRSDEEVRVVVRARAEEEVAGPAVGLGVFTDEGTRIFGTNTSRLNLSLGKVEKGERFSVFFAFPQLGLAEGSYLISVMVHTEDGLKDFDRIDKGFRIFVENVKGFHGIFDLNPVVHMTRGE